MKQGRRFQYLRFFCQLVFGKPRRGGNLTNRSTLIVSMMSDSGWGSRSVLFRRTERIYRECWTAQTRNDLHPPHSQHEKSTWLYAQLSRHPRSSLPLSNTPFHPHLSSTCQELGHPTRERHAGAIITVTRNGQVYFFHFLSLILLQAAT